MDFTIAPDGLNHTTARYLPSEADRILRVVALDHVMSVLDQAQYAERFTELADTALAHYRANCDADELADWVTFFSGEVARLSGEDQVRALVMLAAATHVLRTREWFQAVC